MTRFVSDAATIGLSCGHRVPRVTLGYGKGYWCEECGRARLSGGKCTGEHGMDWALLLREEVEASTLPVLVPDPGTEHGRAVVLAFGAEIAA